MDAAVAARMRRQEVLYDTGKTFEFVITEAALRYLLCPPQVMLGQLDRLLSHRSSAMSRWDHPARRRAAVAPMVGFLMADDITIVETFTSAHQYPGQESPSTPDHR